MYANITNDKQILLIIVFFAHQKYNIGRICRTMKSPENNPTKWQNE